MRQFNLEETADYIHAVFTERIKMGQWPTINVEGLKQSELSELSDYLTKRRFDPRRDYVCEQYIILDFEKNPVKRRAGLKINLDSNC